MHHQPMPSERVLARRRAIGAQIQAARARAGLTQEAVSLRTDIRIATISEIETGYRAARLDSLILIADAIGVDLADLVRT
ncbi:MAG TPA: transcriptional regulator [Streptomyces sp.]|nr:transcriptional regulator [Streptomyces sp.]